MASMFYQPAIEILKSAGGVPIGASEVKNRILAEYPDIQWSGTQGPVRAMLLSAANSDTPIRQVPDSRPPLFYYDSANEGSAEKDAPEPTPEETMDAAFTQAQDALKAELLTIIRKMDDSDFEILVNKVVARLGFGTPETTSKCHDGGIDGYICGDRLGLNVVCVQAKRYDGHNVQRPAIDAFIGALEGRNGVFVTSSGFAKEAIAKAQKTGSASKIALIDGERLVNFMIECNLGVQETDKKYILKKVDHDFFENLED